MKNKKTHWSIALALIVFVLTGVFLFTGCKKKSEPIAPAAVKEIVSEAIEQTTCPVMGGAINKELYTEHNGKKVYFCCPECKGKFEKEPEKYIGKLPQFKN